MAPRAPPPPHRPDSRTRERIGRRLLRRPLLTLALVPVELLEALPPCGIGHHLPRGVGRTPRQQDHEQDNHTDGSHAAPRFLARFICISRRIVRSSSWRKLSDS